MSNARRPPSVSPFAKRARGARKKWFTSVASAAAVLLGSTVIVVTPVAPAMADAPAVNMYAFSCGGNSVTAYGVDSTTGNISAPLGSVSLPAENVCAGQPAFDAATGGSYVMVWGTQAGVDRSWLYAFNADTGSLTAGAEIHTGVDTPLHPVSMAIDGAGNAFVAEDAGGKFLALNLATGAASPLGDATLPGSFRAMAYDPFSATIQGITTDGTSHQTYVMNPATGEAVATAETWLEDRYFVGLQFDSSGGRWVLDWFDNVNLSTLALNASSSRVGWLATTQTDGAIWAQSLLIDPRPAFSPAPVPTISGTTAVGQTLTANTGTWLPAPTSFTYQWNRAGIAIDGATSSTYSATVFDLGQVLTVTVTASAVLNATTRKTSADTTAIVDPSYVVNRSSINMYAFGCGGSQVTAYKVNATDATATQLGSVALDATNVCAGPAAFNPATGRSYVMVWGTQGGVDRSWLYEFDVVDGTLTLVSELHTGVNTPALFFSMAIDGGGHAFVAQDAGGKLLALDLSTGATAELGTATLPATFRGMAFDPAHSAIYAISYDGDKLYVINGATGEATLTNESWHVDFHHEGLQFDAGGVRWVLWHAASSWDIGTLTSGDVGMDDVGMFGPYMTTRSLLIDPRLEFASSPAPTPTISGTMAVGQTLTAVPGALSPSAESFTHQWKRDGVAVSNATSSTFDLSVADIGHTVSVTVTAVKAGYLSKTLSSVDTAVIPPQAFVTTPTPTISGTTTVGETLTAATESWSPAPDSLGYVWKRGGTAIEGATSATYVLQPQDAGAIISATITATKVHYASASQTSAGTAAITSLPFTTTPLPTISGAATVGETLTAVPGTWAPAAESFTYVWKRAGTAISAATAATYMLQAADAGQSITVTVSAVTTGYTTSSQTSEATSTVGAGTFRTSPIPTISGTTAVDETLTANTGTWSPVADSFTYQWKRSGGAIDSATASTYVLQPVDVGRKISVTVTATTAGYLSASQTSADKSIPLTFTIDGLTYSSHGSGQVYLTAAPSPSTTVVIPASVTYASITYSVTGIGNSAFLNKTTITSVTLSEGLLKIDDGAFQGMTALTAITIPDSVWSIGGAAFAGDTSLTSVHLGTGVTTIWFAAFRGDTSLTSVTIPSGVTFMSTQVFRGNTLLTDVYFLGAPPATITSAGSEGTLGLGTGLKVHFNRSFQAPGYTNGFTSSTWKGYETEVNPYVVSYVANTGTGTPSVTSQNYVATALTLPTVGSMTKDGYTFQGWSTTAGDRNGEGATVLTGDYTPTASVTLYAVWASEPLTFVVTPTPTISGTTAVGETLTALPGSWSPEPTSFTYVWKRAGSAIDGATAATYDLQAADAGHVISVTVTAVKTGRTASPQTSAETAAIDLPMFEVGANPPAISGTLTVGQTLSAGPGSWTPEPTSRLYQWSREGAPISGAHAQTYVLQSEDAGHTIAVIVTAIKAGYRGTAVSSLATTPIKRPFTTAPTPVIVGTATVGERLTVAVGSWSPSPTFTYAWKRNGATIGGATSSGYKLVAADGSARITVEVTASRTGFASATVTSGETSAVAAGVLTAATPVLSGEPTVGQKLTATVGSWSPSPTLTYVWKRDGVTITGATLASYRLVPADEGARIVLEVTGSRSGYASSTMASAQTNSVAATAFLTVPIPEISGTVAVGQRLTAVPGVWAPAASLTYVWKRNGAIIAGAGSSGYRIVAADAGTKISVQVTGSRSGYAPSTRTSTETVTVPLLSFALSPTPTITGTFWVGQTLKANRLVWAPSPDSFTYQWLRNGVAIRGATNKTYALQVEDALTAISVEVTAVKVGYSPTTRTSVGPTPLVSFVD